MESRTEVVDDRHNMPGLEPHVRMRMINDSILQRGLYEKS